MGIKGMDSLQDAAFSARAKFRDVQQIFAEV
jgi:hypothetical protein